MENNYNLIISKDDLWLQQQEREAVLVMFGGDEEKTESYLKGLREGRAEGTKESISDLVDSILHPIDTIVDAAVGIWEIANDPKGAYDQVVISYNDWEELLAFAMENDPKAAGEMLGLVGGKLEFEAGLMALTSGGGAAISSSGKLGQLLQKLASDKKSSNSSTSSSSSSGGKGNSSQQTSNTNNSNYPKESPDGVSYRIDQPDHLAKGSFTQKNGVSGGHNADDFYGNVDRYSIKVENEIPTGTPGITTIEYRIPAIDQSGNPTGAYKGNGSKPYSKTIYDPKVFTDEKIMELGQKAASSGYDAAMKSPRSQYTATAGGVKFRVYLDKKTGTVTNFHPE